MIGKADITRRIEEGLGSATRLRILRILSSMEPLTQTKYSLERLTGLSPVYVRKHLAVLLKTGWIKELDFTPTVYTMNLDDTKVKLLLDFFKKTGYL